MKRGMTFRWGAVALALLACALAVPALAVTVHTVAKFRMTYNEEGNHFDGLVVHHGGSEYVYALMALVLWSLVVVVGVGAYRTGKRTRG
jgi:hypothetical protein